MQQSRITALALLLLGCPASGPSDPPTTEASSEPTPVANDEPSEAEWSEASVLVRGEGHAQPLTEAWLDPTATAALSLDRAGEVRLWPLLSSTTEASELAPIRVPLHEPAQLSFARTSAGSYVIAAIDTMQAARVLEIRIDETGQARMLERLRIPPSDPLLELNVLPGGERLLALGVDHRIRLLDRHGATLELLVEHGFVPWQLRIAGTGDALHLAAVLTSPTRVQRLELLDDRLRRVGTPLSIELDRGPNHNDLVLTPDGQAVVLLRRPEPKTKQWSLQRIDLESGAVRVLAGAVEQEIRPRLHLVDAERALLEDGSGRGFWVDLRGGVEQGAGFVLPERLEDLPSTARVQTPPIPLAGSSADQRMHASVVAGLRVVPDGHALILDPLDSDQHHRLGHAAADSQAVALDGDGSHVAWQLGGAVYVETLSPAALAGPLQLVRPARDDSVVELAFTDPEHLLIVTDRGASEIHAWKTGEPAAVGPQLESLDRARYAPTSPGTGWLGVRPSNRHSDAVLLELVGNAFGSSREASRDDFAAAWPELERGDPSFAIDGLGRHYTGSYSWRRATVEISGPGTEQRVIEVDHDEFTALFPSPDGRHLAVVQHAFETTINTALPKHTHVHLWSMQEPTPKRLWSVELARRSWNDDRQFRRGPFTPPLRNDVAWSADGGRVAIVGGLGIHLVLSAAGELLLEREFGPLVYVQQPDPD
jgi:hypothetical protein